MTFDELCVEYEKQYGDFMVFEDTGLIEWWMIETITEGTVYIPVSDCPTIDTDTVEFSDVESIQTIQGYGMRLTAPGYLDCTEWVVMDDPDELVSNMAMVYLEG